MRFVLEEAKELFERVMTQAIEDVLISALPECLRG
jgi:hypothetical protein